MFFAEALRSGGALVVLDRAKGQVIGSSRYHGYDVGFENRRSQRAVEKIGGVRAGTTTDAQGRERAVYELTSALYAARR